MTDGYRVVTTALRAEAGKWDEYAQTVAPVHRTVQDATLGPTAFFVGDLATIGLSAGEATVHQASYQAAQQFMETVLAGAVAEFAQIAQALVKAAVTYEQNEAIVELNLNEIYGD